MSEFINQAAPVEVHQVRTVDVAPHTIIVTCGPSSCGKTWFTEHVLLAQLRGLPPLPGRRTVHAVRVGSDDCRRELLADGDVPKHAERMLPVSAQAFNLLKAKLRALTSFPVNAEFVVVDSKGLSPQLMADVAAVAKEHHYGVMALVFQYRSAEEYRRLLPDDAPVDVRRTIEWDAKNVFRDCRGNLKKAGIVNQVVVPSRAVFSDFRFTSAGHDLLRRCTLAPSAEVLVVPDVHGCFTELRALLEEHCGVTLNDHLRMIGGDRRVVLAGDFIDKGPESLDVLRFIRANRRDGRLLTLVGNHEHRLFRELTGQLPHLDDPRFGYTTFDQLSDPANEELRAFFVDELYPGSLPFLRSDGWVVTHAPCAPRYLGKVDGKSIRTQRYTAYELAGCTNLADAFKGVLALETDLTCTTHVFGHVATSTPGRRVGGRMFADGGCVLGGQLLGVVLNGRRSWTVAQPSTRPRTDDPMLPVTTKDRVRIPTQMDPEDEALARRLAGELANYASGTMSPAKKSADALETVANALAQFKAEGCAQVVIQPKYMGSRVNVYLAAEGGWVCSRSGRRVDDLIDPTPAMDQLRARLEEAWPELLPDGEHVRMVVVDGELLPWRALGEGLVTDVQRYLQTYRRETIAMREAGFDAALARLRAEYEASGYAEAAGKMTRRELAKRFPRHRVYAALEAMEPPVPTDRRGAYADVLEQQINRFGADGPLELRPFGLLKVVYADGREAVPNLDPVVDGHRLTNAEVFNRLNPDGCLVVGVDDVEAAEREFTRITGDLGMEGVVIKPLELDHVGLPYLKVRGADYLTIVYGADYLHPAKHAKLVARRSTRAKRELSVKEWRLGLECLRTPADHVAVDEQHVRRLAALVGAQRREQGLDPRL